MIQPRIALQGLPQKVVMSVVYAKRLPEVLEAMGWTDERAKKEPFPIKEYEKKHLEHTGKPFSESFSYEVITGAYR